MLYSLPLVFLFGLNSFFLAASDVGKVPPDQDVDKDMPAIVAARGYQIESHFVTTNDGYILNMFRIPSGKHEAKSASAQKPAVILQHGLLDSSYAWVCNFETESLGYILADAGFDVWFGNNRGNRYGRNHTTLNPDDGTNDFWAFTWDDMASQDVPAMIHYVLDATDVTSIGWVGHSEGTIQMFAAGSSVEDSYVQEALSHINLFVALAPVAYVTNLASKPIVVLADAGVPQKLLDHGLYEFLPYGRLNDPAAKMCEIAEGVCNVALEALCGPSQNLNESRIQVYVSETPAGTSTQNLLHWAQGVESPNFQKFDYGTDGNMAHYGTAVPPMYDLSKMTIPTALFSGSNDYLADPMDVQRLMDELNPEKLVFVNNQDTYAHLDFTWAPCAGIDIYKDVSSLLVEYST